MSAFVHHHPQGIGYLPFIALNLAVGISETIIQQQGPHPNWKKAANRKMQVNAK
jgi:hypothetical protein